MNTHSNIPGLPEEITTTNTHLPASQVKRFFNFLIDTAAIYILYTPIIIFLLSTYKYTEGTLESTTAIIVNLLGYIIMLGYYIVCEYCFQRTLGKLITKTKVVRINGERPTFKQIIGRTFSRMIPFEPVSLLRGKTPIGWHDSLAKTLVVPYSYTKEQVHSIDRVKSNSKGAFKFIVTVFIIIFSIGIISSLILATLKTVKKRNEIKQIQIQQVKTDQEAKDALLLFKNESAPNYFAQNSGYGSTTSCGEGLFEYKSIGTFYLPSSKYVCIANDDAYRFLMILPESKRPFCVDSKGYFGEGLSFSTGCEFISPEQLSEYGY